ncbi:MAG TPA: DUF2723 domain-containing protein [Ignavibacteriaceae bacterium]|nr:DUF2723 domain-containing protein [Ignavibacteriaceae bacterium]
MKIFNKYYYVLTGFVAFIFYLLTIAPTVLQIDAGELAAVQCTLGIAHPTGYPLFTMLGHLFSLIPLPLTKIFQLNILAALYCTIAVSVFTYSAKFILDNLNSFQFDKNLKVRSKKKKDVRDKKEIEKAKTLELSEPIKQLIAISGGLFLALSKSFWFQSTSVEVYSLHLLLITIIILASLKAFVNADKEKNVSKYWMIFAVTLAFGFTNHMTTLLILPGTAYLYFTQNGFNKKSIKQIMFMLIIFFPILFLIYSYLPIRAAQNPDLNWGNPVDWERILRHISGKQYQVWLFSSTEAAAKQLNYFISNLSNEFTFTLLLILSGIVISFIEAKKLFIFLIITFFSTVLYSINYDINDIDSYFLLAYISMAFFALFGIQKLFHIANQKKIKSVLPIIIVIIFLLIQFKNNYAEVNQKQNYVYEDYTKSLLNSLPKNSIVFSYQWDYLISPSYYFQLVEHFRDDVTVIDKELLRRSWYYNQLQVNHPKIIEGIQPGITGFLNALAPFERGENFNANLLENFYRKIMTGLVSSNISKHNYFIAPEIVEGEIRRGEFQLPTGYTLVPHLFLFEVVNTTDYVKAPLPEFKIRFSNIKDKYALSLEKIIANMLAYRAKYELKFNETERAKIYVRKIAAEFKDFILPPELQRLILD